MSENNDNNTKLGKKLRRKKVVEFNGGEIRSIGPRGSEYDYIFGDKFKSSERDFDFYEESASIDGGRQSRQFGVAKAGDYVNMEVFGDRCGHLRDDNRRNRFHSFNRLDMILAKDRISDLSLPWWKSKTKLISCILIVSLVILIVMAVSFYLFAAISKSAAKEFGSSTEKSYQISTPSQQHTTQILHKTTTVFQSFSTAKSKYTSTTVATTKTRITSTTPSNIPLKTHTTKKTKPEATENAMDIISFNKKFYEIYNKIKNLTKDSPLETMHNYAERLKEEIDFILDEVNKKIASGETLNDFETKMEHRLSLVKAYTKLNKQDDTIKSKCHLRDCNNKLRNRNELVAFFIVHHPYSVAVSNSIKIMDKLQILDIILLWDSEAFLGSICLNTKDSYSSVEFKTILLGHSVKSKSYYYQLTLFTPRGPHKNEEILGNPMVISDFQMQQYIYNDRIAFQLSVQHLKSHASQ